ncbi:hypothetical protein [Zhongshania sp.]|uniref:hypothetical protein n=1 Tax=Zhongshania sp. TaxID=1971902 RepID=UPI00356816B4
MAHHISNAADAGANRDFVKAQRFASFVKQYLNRDGWRFLAASHRRLLGAE